jgi:hypothetical protein
VPIIIYSRRHQILEDLGWKRGAQLRLTGHAQPPLDGDAAHLPARHLAEVAHVRVEVLLDGHELGVLGEQHGRLEALLGAPEAGWQGEVSCLVVHAGDRVDTGAVAVDRRLVAEDLHLVARVVSVEPDALAGRGVAVAAGVNQPHVANRVVVGDGMHAFAVVAAGTVAGAGGARAQLGVWADVRVASDLGVLPLDPEGLGRRLRLSGSRGRSTAVLNVVQSHRHTH